MSNAEKHEIIIVRHNHDEEHEHHSSAWKVAHADFMTAMMAFFLVMWLINVTDKDVRKAIANYFNPVNLAESNNDRRGLNDPENASEYGTSADGTEKSALKETEGEGTGLGMERQRGDSEQAAFQDPYGILAKLAAKVEDPVPSSPDVAVGETGKVGMQGGEAHRDPFDPIYWQTVPSQQSRSEEARPLKGTGLQPPPPPAASESDSLAQVLTETLASAPAPAVSVEQTGEGLVISLTDHLDFGMFPVGSAVPDPRTVKAMEKIAGVLAERPGGIVIRGHTDGRPFQSKTYDNWQLSSARAQMAFYMLTRAGIPESRIESIEGRADRDLKDVADPQADENRRIEILVRPAGDGASR